MFVFSSGKQGVDAWIIKNGTFDPGSGSTDQVPNWIDNGYGSVIVSNQLQIQASGNYIIDVQATFGGDGICDVVLNSTTVLAVSSPSAQVAIPPTVVRDLNQGDLLMLRVKTSAFGSTARRVQAGSATFIRAIVS